MPKVSEIYDLLNIAAPVEYAADYDNVGQLVGDCDLNVKSVLVALDITREVIREAAETGAGLIVSHHPVIFGKLSRVVSQDVTGKLLIELIKNNISAICMHTNLDVANGGVNDIIAKKIGLSEITALDPQGEDSTGVFGGGRTGEYSKEISIYEFMSLVKGKLGETSLRYYNSGKRVRRVAVGGGSCGGYLEGAFSAGCDTLLTADIKHDRFLRAREFEINLIDAGHFSTENVVCPYLQSLIKNSFPKLTVNIAKANISPYKYF